MMFYPANAIKQVFAADLIAAIAFMRRLHKHKGPLFVYKKHQQGQSYRAKPYLDYTPISFELKQTSCRDDDLVTYHPYLHLFNDGRKLFYSLEPIYSSVPNTTAICEWLRAYMKSPPLAAQVRAFEQSTLKQAKEVKTYLRGFFREDTLFYWHSILIGFAGQITTPEELTYKLTEITVFRTKLLSQLKNHDLITEEHTRYCWKIIVIGNQLSMHLQILHRQLLHKDDVANAINPTIEHKNNNKEEQFIKQIKQSAETVKIPISPEPSVISSFSIDTKEVKGAEANPKGAKQKKVKRANFNACLEAYFNQDFWFAYYQIACENPKKMLFGKGNDKGGK